jgi:patatin-like phospholipase/acyl hydrolase
MVKYLLCLSGGGVRGAIIASFLQELEKELEEKFSSNIYDKFDMFAGTSTGSLIVGALAYEKFSGKKINEELYNVVNSQKIINKSCLDKILGIIQHKPKYTNDGLKKVIDSILTSEKLINDTKKHTIITAFDVEEHKPVIFKSFSDKHNIPLKSAMCMSSATPCYFPTFHDKKSNMFCIDGGLAGLGDPSEAAYAEALKLYGKDEDIRILSIGTGYKNKMGIGKESEKFGGIQWLTKGGLMDIMMDGPQKAVKYKMKTFTEVLGHKYLHIDGEIENSNMDDVSEENINALKHHGKLWFEKYKEQLNEFFI